MMYNYIIENYTNGEPIFLKELPGESRDYLRQEMKKMKDPVAVVFEEAANRSAAYKEGELIGECEFSVSEQIWIIDHTGVRPAYGGQGIAKRLVEKVIEEARKANQNPAALFLCQQNDGRENRVSGCARNSLKIIFGENSETH